MSQKARHTHLPKPGARARSPEAKSARRECLLESAMKLFGNRPLDRISMEDIARAAKVAKGTVYLYFSTKEEIFLALMRETYSHWFDSLDRELVRGLAWQELPAWIASELDCEPRFLRLLCLLHAVLEENIELDAAREFKSWLVARMEKTGFALKARYSWLRQEQIELLLLQVQCLAIGAAQMSRPSPVMTKVLEDAEFACLRIEFKPFLEAGLNALFASMPAPHLPAR